MPIMKYDEYSKIEHDTPYMYSFESKGCFVYYFGERHSFDPQDKQWVEEKKFWNDFLEKTKSKKRIVFIEGGIRKYIDSEEQSILKNGGMGLATYLAHQEGVETYSPEPTEIYERNQLEKEFSRDQIQYYYFARIVQQWGKKRDPKPHFEEYVSMYLKNDKDRGGWQDFDFSIEHMKKIHQQLFNTKFDEYDTSFFYGIINPTQSTTIINRVSAQSGELRDEYIAQEIQKYIADGYSIYVQYGASHAVMQEPFLKKM